MLQKVWYWAWRIASGLFALSIVSVLIFRFVPVPCTPLMLIRCGEQVIDGKPIKLNKNWESLEHISPNLVQAVVASEDNLFLSHHGFDFAAMEKAMKYNSKKKGKKIKGGSTISQQTAKNVFLWPGRSYLRKGS
jgi:monofunctional biosynthetic peptidoglycan transglycosylase